MLRRLLNTSLANISTAVGNANFWSYSTSYTAGSNIVIYYGGNTGGYVIQNNDFTLNNSGYYLVLVKAMLAVNDAIVAIVRNTSAESNPYAVYELINNGSGSIFFSTSSGNLCFKYTSGTNACVFIIKLA